MDEYCLAEFAAEALEAFEMDAPDWRDRWADLMLTLSYKLAADVAPLARPC